MTFEDLKKANETLSTMDIKGKSYVLVNERVRAFRMLYPEGTIKTEILSLEDGIVMMRAEALDEDGKLLSSGFAYEKESSSYINKTSYIENCETSAVGRALGFLGIGVDTSIASYEEVQNAVNNQVSKDPKSVKESMNLPEDRITEEEALNLFSLLKENDVNIPALCKQYKVKRIDDLSPAQMLNIYGKLGEVRKNEANRNEGQADSGNSNGAA